MAPFFVQQESNTIPYNLWLTNMCSCYIILLIKEVIQHMKITKAYQFRLYPTKEQKILIHKILDVQDFYIIRC